MINYTSEKIAIDALTQKFQELKNEIGKSIVGQQEVVESCLISIFSNGHCLLVGVPGLAKTLLVQTIAGVLELSYNRVQFTPDLMPSDITGAEILDENRNFKFIKGPIFSNIILADEINRTPPKTQAALLEAMQERSVTVAGVKNELPAPFFVLATQNPIEQEGTYPLPEAQLDRFMFNIIVNYPTLEEEINIVKNTTGQNRPSINKIMTGEEILYFQQLIRKMPVADNVLEYAVKLASSSRPEGKEAPSVVKELVDWGAGPRASQYLVIGAKTHAALNGKYSPDIENVKAVAELILRHRIVRNFKAEAEGISTEEIIEQLL